MITPVKRLIAFRKAYLKAGEKKEIRFTFVPADFSFVNALEHHVTEPGEFEIMVGSSSNDCDLQKLIFARE